jgi:hypothetical protein
MITSFRQAAKAQDAADADEKPAALEDLHGDERGKGPAPSGA